MLIVGGVVGAWSHVDYGVGGEVRARWIRTAGASRLSIAAAGAFITGEREAMLSSAQSVDA